MKYTADNWPIAAKMAWGPNAKNGDPIELHRDEWIKQLKQVRFIGFSDYDPTDLWVPFWEFNEVEQDDFISVSKEIGLSMPALSMGRKSVVDVSDWQEYVDTAYKFVDFAVKCGAQVVNIGFQQDTTSEQNDALWFWHEVGHVDDPDLRDLGVERIQKIADYAATRNVQISMEMYEDTYMGTPDEAVSFIKDVDRPNVGINPDIGNLVRLHRPMDTWESMYSKVLPYANFWHIKNYLRDEDRNTGAYFSAPATLETGIINYRKLIEDAVDLGYNAPFMVEQYGGDWLGVGARNARYIRQVLKSLEL